MAGLDDISPLSFNGIDLYTYCPEMRDAFGPRFAGHVLWGRDGAKQEEGGNAPRKVKVHLNFAGDTWLTQVNQVLGGILRRPRGKLVHPILGTFQAVCKEPIQGVFSPSQKGACYEVDLNFEEDAYDQRQTFAKGPAAQAKIVTEQADAADMGAAAVSSFLYERHRVGVGAQRYRRLADSAVGQTSGFTAAARSFAAVAIEQYNSGTWDPSLEVRLKQLPTLATPAIQALRLASEYKAYDATTAVNQALAAATDLDLAIRAQFPIPIMLTVQGKMSLYDLCQALYPHKARSQRLALAEQILRINRLARPDALLAGQQVQVPAP